MHARLCFPLTLMTASSRAWITFFFAPAERLPRVSKCPFVVFSSKGLAFFGWPDASTAFGGLFMVFLAMAAVSYVCKPGLALRNIHPKDCAAQVLQQGSKEQWKPNRGLVCVNWMTYIG